MVFFNWYLYYVRVFAYLDNIVPTIDPDTGLKAFRISVVSDGGLPDTIEFDPPHDPADDIWKWQFYSKPVRVKIDLKEICEYFNCEEEELNDGFTRYTFLVSDLTLELPGVVSFVPRDGGSGNSD